MKLLPRNPKTSTAALLFSALALVTASCVTVNVNFPESAVQKATDDYVRELYRAKERTKPAGVTASPSPRDVSTLFGLLEPAALAEGSDFKVNSDKALAIRDQLAARLDDVLEQKRAGTVGETSEGLLAVRGADKLKPLLAKKVQKLVDEENSLRRSLYSEVLSSNGLAKGRLKEIEKSFSRSFQAASPSGTWVQDESGDWSQKR